MGHWGLVLGVRCPSWTSPMPTVILKCQIRLFHDLKNAGYLAFLLWFLELQSRVWTERAIVTPTDDIVRPKSLCYINLMILEWLST